MFQLIVDTREQAIRPYLEQLFDNTTDPVVKTFKYNIVQLNIGDFIINYNGKPLCCIERKTLTDFGASITDQRYKVNTAKMIDLRVKTGCKLIYIVESDIGFPSKTRKFSRIPYGHIESAMDTLMLLDDIHVIKTKDNEHTLLRILDLMKKYSSIYKKHGIMADPIEFLMNDNAIASDDATATTAATAIAAATATAAADVAAATAATVGGEISTIVSDPSSLIQALSTKEASDIADMLTKREPRSDEYNAIEMWSSLVGISAPTANVIVTKCSIVDFIKNPIERHIEFKTESGRALTKKAIDSLFDLAGGNQLIVVKCLEAIEGISMDVASQIVEKIGPKLNEYTIERLAEIKIQQKTRSISLGINRATKIMNAINYHKK